MAAEGEPLPQRPMTEQADSARSGSKRRRRRGRGNAVPNARPAQSDPRRSEPREPAYAQPRRPDPSRPAPVIQRKRTFAGLVGALLGRKPQTEE